MNYKNYDGQCKWVWNDVCGHVDRGNFSADLISSACDLVDKKDQKLKLTTRRICRVSTKVRIKNNQL